MTKCAPVSGAKVTVETDVESPEQYAARYASGPLAKRIVAGIRPHLHGTRALATKKGEVPFKVRVPCSLRMRIEHPDYAPAELTTELDREHLQKTIFLTRPGRGKPRILDE